MAISRRAFGIGLLATSAAGTGGYVYLRQHPEIAGRFGEPKRLSGFAGGEKEGGHHIELGRRGSRRDAGNAPPHLRVGLNVSQFVVIENAQRPILKCRGDCLGHFGLGRHELGARLLDGCADQPDHA